MSAATPAALPPAAAPTPAAFAVSLGAGAGGSLAYTLAQGLVWRLLALSFTVDLFLSGSDDDVFVRLLNEAGALIAGEVPGSSQAAGSAITYSLSPFLNPCDGITSGFFNLSPDTFPSVTLTGGCQIAVDVVTAVSGVADSSAAITDATAWMENAAPFVLPLLEPIYLPIPIVAGGLTTSAAGG